MSQSTTEPATAPDEDTTDTEETEAQEAEDEKGDEWDPDRAKRKIRKLNSENEALRRRANEAPKPEDVQAKDKTIGDLTLHNLRLTVGYELGLPYKVAKRLQGATREELIADAEDLIEEFAPTKAPPSNRPKARLRGGGEPDQEPEETDLGKIASRMFKK